MGAWGDIAGAALAGWLRGGRGQGDEERGVFGLMAEVVEVGAGDFAHRGAATRDELVGPGLRVGSCLDIGVTLPAQNVSLS